MGCSVFNRNEFYEKFLPYLQVWIDSVPRARDLLLFSPLLVAHGVFGNFVLWSCGILIAWLPLFYDWFHQRFKKLRDEGKVQELYFTSVDVKGAFDSIPHDKLQSLFANLFEEVWRILR